MHRYERIVFWSEEDQKWIVDVPELSGCMADGATPVEALENVETIIDEWIETARAIGHNVQYPDSQYCWSRKN